MTRGTVSRYERVLGSFVRFAMARGVRTIGRVDARLCLAFAVAPIRGRGTPSASTSRFRLTVVRDACLGWFEAGVIQGDPTIGLRIVQPQRVLCPAPLTPPEVRRLRSSRRVGPRDFRGPAAVELALLGATHLEVAAAVVGDLDGPNATMRIGSGIDVARCGQLDAFSMITFRARMAALQRECRRSKPPWLSQAAPLALARPLATYPAESIAPGVSSTIARALRRAGVDRPGLRPRSLREYAANRCYALSGRVEDVALELGLSSVDVAHSFIDPGWQDRWAGEMVPDVLA